MRGLPGSGRISISPRGRFPTVGRLTIVTRGLPVWRGLPVKGRLTIDMRG